MFISDCLQILSSTQEFGTDADEIRTSELYSKINILTSKQLLILRCAEFVSMSSKGIKKLKILFLNENAWQNYHDTGREVTFIKLLFCRLNINKKVLFNNCLKLWKALTNYRTD